MDVVSLNIPARKKIKSASPLFKICYIERLYCLGL